MLTLAAITAFLLAVAAAIRSFRAVENQALRAIQAGRALWSELKSLKKDRLSQTETSAFARSEADLDKIDYVLRTSDSSMILVQCKWTAPI
jgi:hypothetical protein